MVLFYVINFKDDARKARMVSRFDQLGIDLHFVNPVLEDDQRLQNTPLHKRTSSIMLQHLDSIRHFYENTSAKHCIVCEDDIHVSKHLHEHLPQIIQDFDASGLDLLLLGYLYRYGVKGNAHFPLIKQNDNYTYHLYPDEIWGCQMYLISRKHAETLLKKYTIEFAVEQIEKVPYNPDWTITKWGKRALISPMLAVEEGDDKSNHEGQSEFHRACHLNNYNPNVHI